MADLTKRDLYLVGILGPLLLGGTIAGGIIGAAWVKSAGNDIKPLPPTPPTFSLAALIPDEAARVQVGAFYRDLSVAVATPQVRSLDQFRAGQQLAVQILQSTVAFPSVPPAANQAIAERLAAAAGLEPGPLSETQRAALVEACRGIARELLPDA